MAIAGFVILIQNCFRFGIVIKYINGISYNMMFVWNERMRKGLLPFNYSFIHILCGSFFVEESVHFAVLKCQHSYSQSQFTDQWLFPASGRHLKWIKRGLFSWNVCLRFYIAPSISVCNSISLNFIFSILEAQTKFTLFTPFHWTFRAKLYCLSLECAAIKCAHLEVNLANVHIRVCAYVNVLYRKHCLVDRARFLSSSVHFTCVTWKEDAKSWLCISYKYVNDVTGMCVCA